MENDIFSDDWLKVFDVKRLLMKFFPKIMITRKYLSPILLYCWCSRLMKSLPYGAAHCLLCFSYYESHDINHKNILKIMLQDHNALTSRWHRVGTEQPGYLLQHFSLMSVTLAAGNKYNYLWSIICVLSLRKEKNSETSQLRWWSTREPFTTLTLS